MMEPTGITYLSLSADNTMLLKLVEFQLSYDSCLDALESHLLRKLLYFYILFHYIITESTFLQLHVYNEIHGSKRSWLCTYACMSLFWDRYSE